MFAQGREGYLFAGTFDYVTSGDDTGPFVIGQSCAFIGSIFILCVQKLGNHTGNSAGSVLAHQLGKCQFGIVATQCCIGTYRKKEGLGGI